MSYRSHSRALVNPSRPAAFAICDRCGGLTNHRDLLPQYDYNAVGLYNTQLLVCERCLDVPQPQNLQPPLSADPLPVSDPRPENYDFYNDNTLATTNDITFITEDDDIFLPDSSVTDDDVEPPPSW